MKKRKLNIKPPALRMPVWKGPLLSRKGRIVRNLLLSILAALMLYIAMGFPPYTVGGMVDRMERRFLLPDLEPVFVLEDPHTYSSDHLPGRHYTYIIARAGESDYLAFQYDTHLWSSELFVSRPPVLEQGAFCAARIGTIYAAAPAMAKAASATAVVQTRNETFTFSGERLGDEVFGFFYRTEEPNLETAVDFAYREDFQSGPNGYSYSLQNVEVPVLVTLYDEGGKTLDTFDLTVSTMDICSWY